MSHYGVVIDSGSSGSRIQIYSWPDAKEAQEQSQAKSVPQLHQEETWSYKISPGVSTFGDKPEDVWDDHYEDLLEYAEKIIPRDHWDETPIFVLATAGMRLLPEKKRNRLLQQICSDIGEKSDFLMENCEEQVQIIDGETEGLYGWIGLNYLMGQLDNYDSSSTNHESYGFMDMGGASTQISFVPRSEAEIEKHRDDISTLYLRNNDGSLQKWDVFVSTWLGFGANEARKRYIKNLINILPEKNNANDEDDFLTLKVNDPCLPKNAKIDFLHQGHSYDIIGSGDYEQCLKTTYPLLLKNLPCIDDPCLFNGVHAPEIDFEKDKFVGISEYWYTANDVFHMGGEYNFLKFSEKVKLFCESDWNQITENSAKGEYNNLPDSLLVDACFKANWVLNILHEGFNLPRIGIEKEVPEDVVEDFDNHIPFQSAGTIKGSELSWTLGRMLLYASSLIAASDGNKQQVGIQPSDNQHKDFITGGITSGSIFLTGSGYRSFNFVPVLLIFMVLLVSLYLWTYRRQSVKRLPSAITQTITKLKSKYNQYKYSKLSNQLASDLEAGILLPQELKHHQVNGNETSGSMSPSLGSSDNLSASLRTRSFANLQSASRSTSPFQTKKNLYPNQSLLDFTNFRSVDNFVQRSLSASGSPKRDGETKDN